MSPQPGDVLTQLFREYYPSLLRYAIHLLGSREAAEDVVQDVFVRVWQREEKIDPGSSAKSYLFTITRNACLDILAHDKIVRSHAETVTDRATGRVAPAADQIVLAQELSRIAADHVQNLSPRLREIYYLSRDEGLSPKDIAATLGIAVSSVHVQMGKILRALYPALEPWIKE